MTLFLTVLRLLWLLHAYEKMNIADLNLYLPFGDQIRHGSMP